MSPGYFIALASWGLLAAWLIYEVARAPYMDEPETFWLAGIEPASIQDLEDSEADDFALDIEQLRSIRFYNVGDWMN